MKQLALPGGLNVRRRERSLGPRHHRPHHSGGVDASVSADRHCHAAERLARVADRVEAASKALDGADAEERRTLSAQLAHLHRQSIALNVAVILAGIGGAATCAAVLTLFVGALRDMTVASVLFGLFGLAVVCALGAIAAYTVEMVIAGTGIRTEVAQSRREAASDEAVEGAEAHPAAGENGGGDRGAG